MRTRPDVVILPPGLPHAQDDDRHVVGLALADFARGDWIAKADKEAQADL